MNRVVEVDQQTIEYRGRPVCYRGGDPYGVYGRYRVTPNDPKNHDILDRQLSTTDHSEMLLTISTTHSPATDLGYLLHKHPERIQSFDLNFGRAHIFYPEVDEARTTAAMLLEIDPISLVRNRHTPSGNNFSLYHYVNDRPYVASSLMSVAIAEVFSSALNGRCKDRPELPGEAIPLTARIAALTCQGGEETVRALFEPLGYQINVESHQLDQNFPDWGTSHCITLELHHTITLQNLLRHLYLLVPVLDNDKHYWVGADEVEKLLRHGDEWLKDHPMRELISKRYLRYQHHLTQSALSRLTEGESVDPDETAKSNDQEETVVEKTIGLHQQRLETVAAVLKEKGAARVLDLGCGEGKLLRLLVKSHAFSEIVGVDVSHRSLEIAASRLRLDSMPEIQRNRIRLLHGSLIYRDKRLVGFDAAAVVEVIEHLDPFRLRSFEKILFGYTAPSLVVITTPNREYNVTWPSLPAGTFRHRDHRFEWSRDEFMQWGNGVAERFGYAVDYRPVGEVVEGLGAPTQMGVFTR